MFSSYKVLPMTADGDIYALIDPRGDQVAMGTREVCQTLLHLLTTSPLMERPPRYYERAIPKPRVSPAGAPAAGGTESDAVGEAGVNFLDAAESVGAEDGVKVSARVGRAEFRLPPGPGATPYGVLDLIQLGSRSAAPYWYVSLFLVIVIGSALVTWRLLLRM